MEKEKTGLHPVLYTGTLCLKKPIWLGGNGHKEKDLDLFLK